MKSKILELEEHLDYLLTHNKNYTQTQWYELLEISDIVASMKDLTTDE